MKKADSMLKEYARSLNEDTLRLLNMRFSQAMCGDLAEAAEILSNNRSVDNWLSSATNVDEFYEMLDQIADFVRRELSRRGGDRDVA